MNIVSSYEEFVQIRNSIKGSAGFVPTMGALHEGHLSLIRRAREENDNVVVSIFVNPTQFLEGEDLDKYPKKPEADMAICKKAGVDTVFVPSVDDMYGSDELKISAPKIAGYILEGAKRPGHFDGMLQVVMKLLNIVRPDRAYFGMKDAQQLILVKRMVKSYFMDIEIVPCDTVRDRDGLALSSRNAYLSDKERTRALALSRSLKLAGRIVMGGIEEVETIIEKMKEILLRDVDELEYVSIVNRDFKEIKSIRKGESIVLVAARVGQTRLIDNLWL